MKRKAPTTLSQDPFGLLAFLSWNDEWNNFHFNPKVLRKAVKQIQDLGVSVVRLDILWSDVHRGRGRFDFTRYDELISLVQNHGIKILALLHYNKSRIIEGKPVWNHPPDSFEEFADYVYTTVRHYSRWIKHWEIWNEPNHAFYWVAPRDGLKTYSRLLRLSYEAAKRADPECVVLNGGITEPVLQDVKSFYENGARDITDVLAVHTFIDPLASDSKTRFDTLLAGIEKLMNAHDDNKKRIWITEMGCPGIPKGAAQQKWFGGGRVSEEQQAEWLEVQYRIIRDHPRVEKLFWAFYRDTQEFKDATDHLGLVTFDLVPKPSYYRMKNLIHAWKANKVPTNGSSK